MMLTPQHFQLADYYSERSLVMRLAWLFPHGWGVGNMIIDGESLKNNTFCLREFSGILPDGTMVRVPEIDFPPEARDLKGKTFHQEKPLEAFLALPLDQFGEPNCNMSLEPSPAMRCRYTQKTIVVPDYNNGEKKEPIQVASKNLRVVFSDEDLDGFATIKIAEISRNPSGTLGLQSSFIPPCLWIESSSYLMDLLRDLTERMIALSQEFADQRQGIQGQGGMDLFRFSLLQALFSCIPKLSHMGHHGKVHPERLYEVLIDFAGTLGLLEPKFHPKDLPPYDHRNLSRTFHEMQIKIHQVVAHTSPLPYSAIPFTHSGDFWIASLTEATPLETRQYYLVAVTEMPEEKVIETFLNEVKIAWPEVIEIMVNQAMQGVNLHHALRPPKSIPLKVNHHYFRIETQGSYWEEICRAQILSVYLPPQVRPTKLELIVLGE